MQTDHDLKLMAVYTGRRLLDSTLIDPAFVEEKHIGSFLWGRKADLYIFFIFDSYTDAIIEEISILSTNVEIIHLYFLIRFDEARLMLNTYEEFYDKNEEMA